MATPDDIQKRDEEQLLYWVAIRGPAVPSWWLPVSVTVMRRATVRVGKNGEETLWLFEDRYFGETGDGVVPTRDRYGWCRVERVPGVQVAETPTISTPAKRKRRKR
jgi:hypothetical protein